MKSWGLVIFGLLAVLSSVAANACSAVEGYRTPTNFELVEEADLIVLARIVDGPDTIEGPDQKVTLSPIRVLKGKQPSEPLRVFGALAWNGHPIPSMSTTLGQSHFSAGLGACIRMFYPRDGLIVAMFKRSSEGLVQITDPWARAVEDVEAEGGVWVEAVETYVELQQNNTPGTLRQAIEAKRDELSDKADSVATRAIAEDLRQHLLGGHAKDEVPRYRWMAVDMPQESAAVLGDRETRRGLALICKAGSNTLTADLLTIEGEPALDLSIGDQVIAFGKSRRVERRAAPLDGGEAVSVASTEKPLDADTLSTLGRDAAQAAFSADGAEMASAPPFDILQKLALRCDALSKQSAPAH